MYLRAARTITFLVVVLMSLEILGSSVTALPSSSDHDHTLTLHSKKSPTSILGSFLFEKAEEESEKTEEEKDRMTRVILIDFSRIAFSLSFYHTPQVQSSELTFQYDVRPPVHELNCVFLI
jgi:hypothetical protein